MKSKFLTLLTLACIIGSINSAAQTATCLKNVLYPTDASVILPNSGALSVRFADLNNDGKQDMVIASYVPSIDWYIQQSNGQFLKTDSFQYNWNSSGIKLKIADADNNGFNDVFVQMDTGVVIIRNNGTGHIIATDTIQQSAQVIAFEAGDYNDDGLNDVILTTQSPYNELIYKGIGINLYAAGDTIAGRSFSEFKIADINNDSKNDIVYFESGSIGFLKRNAADSLIPAGSIAGSNGVHMELEDLDGDGLKDLLISNLSGIDFYKNAGAFNFIFHQHLACSPQNYIPRDLFAEDMNNDGAKDVVVRSLNYTTVFYNVSGTFDSVNFNKFSVDQVAEAVADIDGDGRKDIITQAFYGDLRAFYNRSNGFFEGDNFTFINGVQPGAKRKLRSFDIDADGDKDVIVFGSGGLDIIRNNNNRTWENESRIYLNYSYGTLNLTDFIFDNLDANSMVDAVLPPFYDNNIYVFHDITQGGNYASMTTMSVTNAKLVSGADFNGDGKKDMAVAVYAPTFGYAPDLRIYLNDGNGNFPSPSYPYMFGMANQFNPSEQMIVADYDHDNFQDIFFHTTGNRIAFSKGTGTATFANPVFIDGTSVASEFLIKDVNNDLFDDFIARGYTDSVKIYLGNASGFTYYGYFNVPPYTADIAVADMNNDGNMDIVASDELNNNIEIYSGQGNGNFTLQYNVPFDGGSAILAENLDNDSYPDVAAVYDAPIGNELRFYYADTLSAIITSGPSSCSNQVLQLQTAATVINWFDGPANIGLANMNPVTVTQSGVYTASVTTSYGCSLTTDSMYVNISACDSVWPGDANMNNVCDGSDLLSLGLNYGAVGISRMLQDNAWSAHAANNWGVSTAGLDAKFSDCNGDGMVDANDTLAINQNFSFAHAFNAPSDIVRTTDPLIHFVSSAGTYLPGQLIDIDILLGTISQHVNNLYGIAFDVSFSASAIQPGSASVLYPNSWLGSPGSNAIKISKVDELAGIAHGAESRTGHTNADGYGRIATLHFRANTAISTATPFTFIVSNYSANDSAGTSIVFDQQSYTIVIDPLMTSSNELSVSNELLVFPNPYSDHTEINYVLNKTSDVSIEVYNSIGQIIKTIVNKGSSAGRYSHSFSAKELGYDAGIYFVKITIDGKTTMKRIVETK